MPEDDLMRNTNRFYQRAWVVLLACVAGLAFLVVLRISPSRAGDSSSPAQQDVLRLETRINQLEQRLYSIEASVRSIDTQSRTGSLASRNVSQQDVQLLTSTIQALQLRLTEDECALAKLDERTLSPAQRQARQRSSGARTDPCRLSADTPLRLPERNE